MDYCAQDIQLIILDAPKTDLLLAVFGASAVLVYYIIKMACA